MYGIPEAMKIGGSYCSESASNSSLLHMLNGVMAMTHEAHKQFLQPMPQASPPHPLHPSSRPHPLAAPSHCHSSITMDEASSSHSFGDAAINPATAMQARGGESRRRKRARVCRNKEEVETQRMTHIAVERNRRKQMNEHLTILRSLMPGPYVQKGDQASIIGGAIEFVKELEQVLGSLRAQKSRRDGCGSPSDGVMEGEILFCSSLADAWGSSEGGHKILHLEHKASSMAEVEVKMVGCSHASVRIWSHCKRDGLLLRVVVAIESLHLTILHLDITTIDQSVLYSLSVKMEVDCKLHTIGELTTSIQSLVGVQVRGEE